LPKSANEELNQSNSDKQDYLTGQFKISHMEQTLKDLKSKLVGAVGTGILGSNLPQDYFRKIVKFEASKQKQEKLQKDFIWDLYKSEGNKASETQAAQELADKMTKEALDQKAAEEEERKNLKKLEKKFQSEIAKSAGNNQILRKRVDGKYVNDKPPKELMEEMMKKEKEKEDIENAVVKQTKTQHVVDKEGFQSQVVQVYKVDKKKKEEILIKQIKEDEIVTYDEKGNATTTKKFPRQRQN